MKDDYYPFPDSTIEAMARDIQQRVNNAKRNGIAMNSQVVWAMIKEARPGWPELEWHKVYQRVRL